MARCLSTPAECLRDHIGPNLANARPRPNFQWKWVADCPVCGDISKLSIEPGSKGPNPPRFVWTCHVGCGRLAIRRALLERADEGCIGNYYAPKSSDPRLVQALRQIEELDKIISTPGKITDPKRLDMAAIIDGISVPADWEGFKRFAARAGLSRSAAYRLAPLLGVEGRQQS